MVGISYTWKITTAYVKTMVWALYIHQNRNTWKTASVGKDVEKLGFVTPQKIKYGVTS